MLLLMPVVLAFVVVVLRLFELLVKFLRTCFSAPEHFEHVVISVDRRPIFARSYSIFLPQWWQRILSTSHRAKSQNSWQRRFAIFQFVAKRPTGCEHNIARRSEMSKLQRKQFLAPNFISTDQIAVFNGYKPSLKLDGLAVQIWPKSVEPFSRFFQTNARRFIFIYKD